MHNIALDRFGAMLMREVRDRAITDWEMIVDGRMCGERANGLRARLAGLDSEGKKILETIAAEIVDTTLHYFLCAVEQTKEIDIWVRPSEGHVESLRKASDGLSGELYSDNGWIARFSEKAGKQL